MQFSSPLYTLNPQYSPFQPPDYTGMRDAFSSQPLQSFNDLMPGQLYDVPQDITNQVPSVNTVSSTLQNSVLKPASVSNTPISYKQKSTTITPTTQQKFQASTFGKNYNLWNTGLNTLNTAFTGLFGEKNAYSGEKGSITRGMDSAYDTIQNNISQIGPAGQLISLGMGANKLLGNVISAIDGGTDGMSTTDAMLDSLLSQLTGVGLVAGLVNGFGGKKADTITKDNLVWEDMAPSYSGSNNTVDEASKKSGKKYGLFSSGARHDANNQIAEAKRQQELVSDIQDEATDRFAIRNSMAAINGNRRKYYLQGGYNQADVRVGKSGMSLDLIAKAKKVLSEPRKLQTGGTAKDPFEYYVSTLPVAQRDSSNFRVRDYWQYNGQPKDFDEAKKRGMFEWVEDFDSNGKSLGWSWHAFTVAKNPNADEYDFMKSSSHPTVQKELDWYNSNSPDAVEFRNNYELQRTEPYWKYVRRKRDTISHKEGGQMQVKATEILIVEPELIEDGVDLFKDGGAINIIPEGALHAHKHNMDIEGITPKGIPVVSNKEGGEVEQQAEIEREEIIFRLEVTKKLEELEKKFYDDDTSQKEKDECALEAGKLLVEEILYNTQDNTGKLI